MNLTTTAQVNNGKLDNLTRELIQATLKGFEGKQVSIEIKEVKNTRSNRQNRYMYGVVYKLAAQGLKDTQGGVWSLDRTKHELKIAVGHYEVYEGLNGAVKEPLPTPQMDTAEFAKLIDDMRALCWEYFTIDIPDPDGVPYSHNIR